MISREQIGITLAAYFGGRAECRIRREAVPVRYVDFTSMYPTVNALLGLWSVHTAARVELVDATDEVRALLARVSLDRMFDPKHWPELCFFARVHVADDILPVRAQYGHDRTYNIGVNRLTSLDPLWYTGPDIVAATLLTGKAPRIDRALRLSHSGTAAGLQSVALRGTLIVDPLCDDLFCSLIEERQRVKKRTDMTKVERDRLDRFMKVMANAGSYGIFLQMQRQSLPIDKAVDLTVYSHDQPYVVSCCTPEEPGRYCCPPIAALITAGARLMLALLERCVADAGGSYAFCDTDSMAIVATRRGGLVPCGAGKLTLPDQRPAIRAVSWSDVDTIVDRFAALNPYARDAVPHSILKVEKYNYVGNRETNGQREIECYAISAKRYALFERRADGSPRIIHRSEHGLGALLNPKDPDDKDVAGEAEECEGLRWITRAWEVIVSRGLGIAAEWPAWCELPAVSRLTTSKPALLAPFKRRNRGKPYADQIKPHNFILTAHIAPNGHPHGVDPAHCLLMAPYESDPRKWARMLWTDRQSGQQYRIFTGVGSGLASRERARVLSYADMLERYETHPEQKSAARDGTVCDRETRGLLGRRHVVAGAVELIGKESHALEDVSAGVVADWDDVLTSYGVAGLRELARLPESLLGLTKVELAKQTGVSLRTLKRIANCQPNMRTRRTLLHAAAEIARARASVPLPDDDRAALEVYRRLPESQRGPVQTCRRCAAPLIRMRGTYCNDACRQAAYRLRHGQHREKMNAKQPH